MHLGLSLGVAGSKTKLGPNLITNGTFDTDLTGWTITIGGTGSVVQSAGTAVITGDGATTTFLSQSIPTIVGMTYLLKVTSITQPIGFSVGTTLISANTMANTAPTPGSYSFTFVANGTTTFINFGKQAAVSGAVDNVSVQLVTTGV